jgi:hypothetical protein
MLVNDAHLRSSDDKASFPLAKGPIEGHVERPSPQKLDVQQYWTFGRLALSKHEENIWPTISAALILAAIVGAC